MNSSKIYWFNQKMCQNIFHFDDSNFSRFSVRNAFACNFEFNFILIPLSLENWLWNSMSMRRTSVDELVNAANVNKVDMSRCLLLLGSVSVVTESRRRLNSTQLHAKDNLLWHLNDDRRGSVENLCDLISMLDNYPEVEWNFVKNSSRHPTATQSKCKKIWAEQWEISWIN